jgi:hypothetical protein
MFREFELSFVPFVCTVLIVAMFFSGLCILAQQAPPPACICKDATRAGELGHLPGCPAAPPLSYSEFREFRDPMVAP